MTTNELVAKVAEELAEELRYDGFESVGDWRKANWMTRKDFIEDMAERINMAGGDEVMMDADEIWLMADDDIQSLRAMAKEITRLANKELAKS